MTAQLVESGKCKIKDEAHLQHLRADLAKLVHWALHDQGNPDIVARIHDCYQRCAVDLEDSGIMRVVRGTVKGELRKAGIDAAVPGVDPALDPPTIILTTRRTIRRLGAAPTPTAPSSALDRKPTAKPATTRARRRAVTPSELHAAFDRAVLLTREALQREGHDIARADLVAAIYNDAARKARLVEQIAATLPPTDAKQLAIAIDGCFRDAFKGGYIERTDRHGQRRAQRR